MNKYKSTAIYSALHFIVDGICAFAMFGWFVKGENNYWYFLAYNFCAFALQMPFGAFLDMLILQYKNRKENVHAIFPYIVAVIGVGLTIIGALLHPIVLGIGNALFHVGGGVGVIYEDHANKWSGKALGIFVAPGALGLFLGTQIVKNRIVFVFACILAILLLAIFDYKHAVNPIEYRIEKRSKSNGILLSIGCFLVVILRSYIGMAVTFSWKRGFILGLICVLAVVFGKMAGGILAAKWNTQSVMLVSLGVAALGYYFSENYICGIIALFTFNMSMPITLYLLVCKFKKLPGFSFGLLTFGLFIGFLPVYFGLPIPLAGNVLGAVGSVVSLLILFLAMKFGGILDGNRNC